MCDERADFLRPCFCCSFFHHHRAYYMEYLVDERGDRKKKFAKERNETS